MKSGEEKVLAGTGQRWYPSVQTLSMSLAVLTVLLLSSHFLSVRQEVVPVSSLDAFPAQLGEWKNQGDQPIEQRFIDILQLTEYLNRWYLSPSGQSINLYAGFVSTQEKQPMIHTPLVCLPGSGWSVRERKLVPWWQGAPGSEPKMVNLLTIENREQRQLVCYWYQANQRIMVNDYEYRLYLFFDSIFKKRTDGALVRFITTLSPDESLESGQERLRDFVTLAVPFINQELPG